MSSYFRHGIRLFTGSCFFVMIYKKYSFNQIRESFPVRDKTTAMTEISLTWESSFNQSIGSGKTKIEAQMSQSPKHHCSPFVKQGKVPLFY